MRVNGGSTTKDRFSGNSRSFDCLTSLLVPSYPIVSLLAIIYLDFRLVSLVVSITRVFRCIIASGVS